MAEHASRRLPLVLAGTVLPAGLVVGFLAVLLTGLLTLLLTGLARSAAASEVELPYLLVLPSEQTPIRYTPGALDRASRLKDRFELFLDEVSSRATGEIRIVIDLLSREEWEASGITVPYGLPALVGRREIALAAWGDDGTVALWRRLAGSGVPALSGAPVRGTIAEAESLSALDLAAEVEVARLLLPALGVDIEGGSDWWEPLIAQTLAWSAFLRYEPDRQGQIALFFAGLEASQASEDDRRGGMAGQVLGAAPYAPGALWVAMSEARPPAKPLLKWLRKKGSAGGPLEREERFRKRYPDVADWLATRESAARP